jgi:hypothetical protein
MRPVGEEASMFRPSRVLVALCLLAAAACGESIGINGNFVHILNFALIRFVNDSNNNGLVFGRQSSCLAVDLSNGVSVTFTNTATGKVITVFTSTVPIGSNITIVAFIGADGAIQFATLNNAFTPAVGKAGLRFFNGAAGAGALTMVSNGSPISSTTPLGVASTFVNVPPLPQTITFVNDTGTVLNAGSLAPIAATSSTIVLGPAVVGTGTPRFFTTTGC